jgi:hypothetical protein
LTRRLEFADRTAIVAQESRWARRHLLLTEKNHVIDAFRQGLLDQAVYEKLLADIDARLLRLESGEEKKRPKRSPLPRTGIESDEIGSNMTNG